MTQYEECFALFDTADKIVALTGAGISTLSGIPDFRGKNGFYTDGNTWNGIRKEELLDIDFFREEPELFYRFAGEFLYPMLQRTPSIAHETLSLMQQKSLCHALYTQNIDCLHTKAGSRTFELHGSLDSHSCTRCNDHAPLQQVLDQVAAGKVPKCTCGGTLRPDFVFYGECLNEELLEQAFHDFETADLVLIMGSSMTVPPVATLPKATRLNGGQLVIVNAQRTQYDQYAACCFRDIATFCHELQQFFHLPQ